MMENANERRKRAFMDLLLKEKENTSSDDFYKPRDGDLIVVGPPKSGTTWLQQILHQIRTKGDENFDDIYEVTWAITIGVDIINLNEDQRYKPRVFKTHEAFGVIKTTEKQKHVVINRDPYDTAYSWAKFVNGYYGGDEEISEDELVNTMITLHENNSMNSFACISTWWQHRNDPNVLYLFYEDLIKDLKTAISKISAFVEIPLTDEELRRITYLCSFEYMSQHKEKFQGDSIIEKFSQQMKLENWKPKVGMVRVDGGKVGQGLNNIGPKLKATVDQLWKKTVEAQTGMTSYQEMYAHS